VGLGIDLKGKKRVLGFWQGATENHEICEALLLELAGCGKTLPSPFDELRANGAALEIIRDFPFMLRLSKHEKHFFRSLLGAPIESSQTCHSNSLFFPFMQIGLLKSRPRNARFAIRLSQDLPSLPSL